MHVLVIPSWYPAYPGDIRGSFFREQAGALQKNGCQIGVIYPQLRSLRDWQSIFLDRRGIDVELDEGVVTYRSHGTNWFPRLPVGVRGLWLRHGLKLFRKYIKTHGKPDVIHVHSMLNAGVLASEIRCQYGIPFVITEHSTSFARGIVPPSEMRLAQSVAKRAARTFAVSPEFASLLNKELTNGEESTWTAISNIVSQIFLDIPLENKTLKKEFRFINVGLMDDKKRQKNIISAFSIAFKNDPSVSCVIGGDGPEMVALKELAVALGVSDRVHFPGMLSRHQVLEEIMASDVFVLSSRYETFGVVVVEALALGKPVIATRCGGPESIVRSQDGILVPTDDVPSLAGAMKKIYQDRERYEATEIREACSTRYSEKAITRQLMAVYLEVARQVESSK